MIGIRGANPGGGDGGDASPPTFFQVGDTISNVPPPPTFWGRIKIDIINVPFCVINIYLRFFFFSFFLSARILNKIRCGNNVARRKVCAVKITAILIELH